MRKTLLILLFLGFTLPFCYGQRPLTHSRQSSYYTYIYKISTADVSRFYKYPDKDPVDNILHHPVDSFKTGKYWENTLPAGNYLKVYAEKNKLKYTLVENHTAFLKVLTNKYDQRFALVDKLGKDITPSLVKENGKTLSFDEKSKTYHITRPKKKNIIQVDYQGIANLFIVKQEGYDEDEDNNKNWLKTFLASIKKLFKKEDNYQRRYNVTRDYTGFMVFNKPKYKPNDTVKFKAFILLDKGKVPVSEKQLLVEIRMGYSADEKIIGKVNSYRDGGFEYSIPLNDSLKLNLDQTYNILLVSPEIEKKKAGDNNNKFDKAGHKILMSDRFYYEEYELKSINFSARLDKDEHYRGVKQAIYLKATDENDLPVPDGRVNLKVTTRRVSSYESNHIFVPDTLWEHKINLDPIGETKVIIPDSIFPLADVDYEVQADFLNSSNESRSKILNGSYKRDQYNTISELAGDTLKTSCELLGEKIKIPAIISAMDANDDTLSKMKAILPSAIIINPNAVTYNIETDSTDTDFDLKDQSPNLSISADRTADSLFVKVNNPRSLHFWYTIFAGSKLIDAGQADQLFYKKKYTDHKIITVLINYIWAGETKFEEASNIVYREDKLNINVKQPVSVYPGQRVQTDIVVTDVNGKPVANIDVTAWSLTRKFENYRTPHVPYLGRSYTYRKFKKTFIIDDVDAAGTIKLNWARWSHEIGLDSIAYYQFTHTKGTYQREELGIDTVTQIAPFIIKDGDIIPTHILYIDEKPVYFSQAQQLQQYSFMVTPGMHSLRFRTSKQIIKLDSICVEPHKKLILSLNADYRPSIKVSDTLSNYEAALINKYMITMVDNFGQKMAMIKQDSHVFLLNPSSGHNTNILTGPLADNFTLFNLQGENLRSFTAEPGYSYLFEPGLLKQTSIKTEYPFSKILSSSAGTEDYTQYALTEMRADSIWRDYLYNRNHSQQLFRNKPITTTNQGQFEIEIHNDNKADPEIRNIIIYKYDDPDFIRVFAGSEKNFGGLVQGRYRMLFLLKDDSYDIKENINIKPYGVNYYKIQVMPTHPKDSVSIQIRNVVNNTPEDIYNNYYGGEDDALKLKEVFNEKYFDRSTLTNIMTGRVFSKDDKLPLPGVSVIVKGTNIGALTDINGAFKINLPPSGTLTIRFIGYKNMEIPIRSGEPVNIFLETDAKELQEVVVIGYGTQFKRDVTGSVATVSYSLEGKVAGLNVIQGEPGHAGQILIRGVSTLPGKEPLYIVNGIIVKNLNGIDAGSISDISLLKDAAATALYGAQAANGAVIITTTTKAKNDNTVGIAPHQNAEESFRKNFSDYAYWQPKLTTDANGKTSFTTTFPDDITNWRTFVIGINGRRQSGFAENQIKSFKPLSASFLAPLFAVEGDEIGTLGKVTNYNSDAIKLTRTFTYNGKQLKQDDFEVSNAKIDTLNITAANTDSLSFEYSIKRDNGYFDGERRKIPVIKQGVKETIGVFEALNSDTTVNLKFDAAKGLVKFHAEASLLPTLIEEAQKLREYKYLCNEQLASKLTGLLAEKQIKAFLGEKFGYEKNITEAIKKLQENRKTQGTWGWWKDTDEELWISLHVIDALTDAQKEGYSIQLDKQKLTDYLVYQLESYKGRDKLVCLQLLHKLEAKVDYAKYVGVIEKENLLKIGYPANPTSAYDKFRLILLKQETGIPVKLDSLFALQHHTMFGNIYWGEDSYRFLDNSIQLSVLAYKIIKNDGKHPEVLSKIRGYFLEQRKNGDWRNTYESALILETILPDLLIKDKAVKPSAITLNGSKTETITQFPYSGTLNDSQLSISKTGDLPVYITGYQQFWNAKPEKVSKDFTVYSWFEKKEQKITSLKGGEPVQLKAEVTVKGDADFVMIEIPIPAGCSYENKEQPWGNNEVHREYFKEKVSIFCRKLKQGKYEFSVNLQPRYSGKYNLNPAKAEMMYFPVFYGREGMKSVVIGQ